MAEPKGSDDLEAIFADLAPEGESRSLEEMVAEAKARLDEQEQVAIAEAEAKIQTLEQEIAPAGGEISLDPIIEIPRITEFQKMILEQESTEIVHKKLLNIDLIEEAIDIAIGAAPFSDKQKEALKVAAMNEVYETIKGSFFESDKTVCVKDGDALKCFLSVDLDTEDIKAKNVLIELTNVRDFKAQNIGSAQLIDHELNVINDGYGPVQIFAKPDVDIEAAVFRKQKGEFRVYDQYKNGKVYTGTVKDGEPEAFEIEPEAIDQVDRIVIEDKSKIITWQDKMKLN